ncbi:permease [Putridiphycobacter roseus]
MAPYLLLGFLIAGLLHVFLPKTLFKKHLGKPTLGSIIKATLLGIPLPLCSCGVIPTGVSIYKNGASKGATGSFLISTPQTGIDSMLITYSLMNIYWAIARPIIALITGVLGGWFIEKTTGTSLVEAKVETAVEIAPKLSLSEKLKTTYQYAFVDFLSDISRQLLLGVLLAAIITTFIPADFLTQFGDNTIISMLIILLASVPMYVCATGSVPIATSLLIIGVSPGAVLVFLMAGPATNIATITVLWRSIGKKFTIAYVAVIVIGAMSFGLLIDYVLDPSWFVLNDIAAAHQHEHQSWINIISGLVLIAMILQVEYKKIFPQTLKIEKMEKAYIVEGMTCNHCKNNVETNVGKMDNVTSAKVDLGNHTLIIEGDITADSVEKKVTDLGYTFKGEA